MRRYVCVHAMLLATSLGAGLIAATPLLAASVSTNAFSANIRLQVQFLVQASKMAQDSASSDKIRRFALTRGAEQSSVLDKMDLRPASEDAQVVAAADTGEITTGRSIAAGPIFVDTYAPPGGVGVLLPAAAVGLDHLANTKGEAFDALYTGLVRNVLTNLDGFYGAYAKTGDDPALRAIAAQELPRVEADKASLD